METKKIQINSFVLHIIAMTLMLCDHIWATVYSAEWLTCIGRIAFPIFAFLCAEGYTYTKNFKKYILRLFIFALISEIPFNLMYASSIIYPFHQNVIWTFIIALLGIHFLEWIYEKKFWLFLILTPIVFFVSYQIGYLTMVDYYGVGILTVYLFHFFRERNFRNIVLQILFLYILNTYYLGGYYYEINLFGINIQIVQQSFAMFALIPIWLYKGEQGPHNKWTQYCFYGFYPLHMLILYLLSII